MLSTIIASEDPRYIGLKMSMGRKKSGFCRRAISVRKPFARNHARERSGHDEESPELFAINTGNVEIVPMPLMVIE